MKIRKWCLGMIAGIFGASLLFGMPASGRTAGSEAVTVLQERLEQMAGEMADVKKKLQDLEAENQAKDEEIEELDDRLNKTELHSATDRISLGVELRTRAD